jgi:AbrB family looped-hinge helix DNA binding protein
MAEVEVIRVSSKGQVVIPKGVRSRLGLKRGDRLLAYLKSDLLLMRKRSERKRTFSLHSPPRPGGRWLR